MFHYSGYWGSWSRVLSTDHPRGPFVEVNLTPIPGNISSTWDNHVRPIRIRFHGTARDHSGMPMSDKDVAELPKEIEQAMRRNLGDALTDRLLTEDFLSQIDYDLYAKKCNAGANLEDIKRQEVPNEPTPVESVSANAALTRTVDAFLAERGA